MRLEYNYTGGETGKLEREFNKSKYWEEIAEKQDEKKIIKLYKQ